MGKPKKVKEVEPYWPEMVEIWLKICRDIFKDKPTFTGSAPRDLKEIVKPLRERTKSIEIEWTLTVAQQRLYNFFKFAYDTNNWLQKNWLLSNINRQKDAVFFNLRKSVSQVPVDPFE